MRHPITGFVLAGGKSSRMGANKAFLPLRGRTLIERAKAVLETVCATVFLVGRRELYGGLGEVCEDIFPGCGPLGGIHAALTHSQTSLNLITAVDTPFITSAFLDYLAERALHSSAMITVPSVAGRIQPLCAVYSRGFLPLAAAALASGDYKVDRLFPWESTLVVTGPEAGNPASLAGMFENLNTPEDFRRARKLEKDEVTEPERLEGRRS